MPQETYSIHLLDEDVDEDRNASTRYAPFENMLSAAREAISCLDSAPDPASATVRFVSKTYAIQGGFSMQLRGGRRSTRDIDLMTNITMRGVWTAITGIERIVIPDSRLVEGVIKVFIKTGAPWDTCIEQHRIEVDVKQAGFRGSPRNLEETTEVLGPFHLFGEDLFFRVLDVASMLRIKVECCLTREEPRDFEDVKYMVSSYPSEVRTALESGTLEEDGFLDVLQCEMIGDSEARARLTDVLIHNLLQTSTGIVDNSA